MKIELKFPYSTIYSCGYIVESQGRRTVILYNSHKNRSSVSLARYKMAVLLKRFLKDDEQVDHIDGNKYNDRINNLQILSPIENLRKSQATKRIPLICPICKKEFIPKKNNFKIKDRCCSRKCGYIKGSTKRN